MKEFINSLTGTRMFVADERAGHQLVVRAAPAKDPDDPPVETMEAKLGKEKSTDSEPAARSEPDAAQSPTAKKRTAAPKRKADAKK